MVTLRLSGLDISESTLRLLQRHMPQLERLDLAHCKDITDSSIAMLAAAGTHTRNNLTELTLAGQLDSHKNDAYSLGQGFFKTCTHTTFTTNIPHHPTHTDMLFSDLNFVLTCKAC